MYPFNIGIIASQKSASGPSYDPDALAYMNKVQEVGGTLTETEKEAVNQLVLDFKEEGLYEKFDIIMPFLGSTANSCILNLIDVSDTNPYTWTVYGTPIFSQTGMKGNQTDAAIKSNFKLNDLVKMQREDGHYGSYRKYFVSSNPIQNNGDGGYEPPRFGWYVYQDGIAGGMWADSVISGFPKADMDGMILSQSRSGNKNVLQLNNVIKHDVADSTQTYSDNLGTAMLAIYYPGQPNDVWPYFSPDEYRFASFGSSFNDAQSTAYYNAVQNFQTTLGRQV